MHSADFGRTWATLDTYVIQAQWAVEGLLPQGTPLATQHLGGAFMQEDNVGGGQACNSVFTSTAPLQVHLDTHTHTRSPLTVCAAGVDNYTVIYADFADKKGGLFQKSLGDLRIDGVQTNNVKAKRNYMMVCDVSNTAHNFIQHTALTQITSNTSQHTAHAQHTHSTRTHHTARGIHCPTHSTQGTQYAAQAATRSIPSTQHTHTMRVCAHAFSSPVELARLPGARQRLLRRLLHPAHV